MARKSFYPRPGEIFIVRHNGREVIVNGEDGIQTITKIQSKDFSDSIYKCLAVDSNLVVGELIYPEVEVRAHKDNKCLMAKRNFTFDLVGPAVIKSLGITPSHHEMQVDAPGEPAFASFIKGIVAKVKGEKE